MAEEPETEALLARAAQGDGVAWGNLLTAHQDRLARMVAFRLDRRLRGRVDAADVVQEAFAEASAHRANYFRAEPPVPLFLWLRGVVSNKLLEVHRHHLGTHMRDAKRDLPLDAPRGSEDTSAAICTHLTAGLSRNHNCCRRQAPDEQGKPRDARSLGLLSCSTLMTGHSTD
jgi:RNA polymerase sigma-70 factor (ECF subfamily)